MKLKAKLLLSAVLATAVLAGCGSGGDSISSPPPVAPVPTIADSVSVLTAFLQNLIANFTNDTDEPRDINMLTLAVDDMAEPAAI